MKTKLQEHGKWSDNPKSKDVITFPPPAPTGDITEQTFLIKYDGIGFLKSKCVAHHADRYEFEVDDGSGETKHATIFWDEWLDQYSLGRVKPTT